jgi:hypothetical protein
VEVRERIAARGHEARPGLEEGDLEAARRLEEERLGEEVEGRDVPDVGDRIERRGLVRGEQG